MVAAEPSALSCRTRIASGDETDLGRRARDLVAGLRTEAMSYVDPLMKTEGHAGVDDRGGAGALPASGSAA